MRVRPTNLDLANYPGELGGEVDRAHRINPPCLFIITANLGVLMWMSS